MDGLMMRRHALLARPLVSPLTVSGPTPLLMPGALAKPMRKATFGIEAVQAGTGDPSPSNVRPITGWTGARYGVRGINQCPDKKYQASARSVSLGTDNADEYPFFFKKDVTYHIDYNLGVTHDLYLKEENDANGRQIAKTFTPSKTGMHRITVAAISNITVNDITEMMLNVGTTASPYTPYSGSTVSVSFPAMGRNLLDNSSIVPWTNQGGLTLAKNADGSFTVNGTATSMMYQQLTIYLKAGTYTMTGGPEGGSSSGYSIFIGDGLDKYDFGSGSTFTVANDGYYRMACPRIAAGTVCNNLTFKPMIQTGTTATSYEPYTNTVYSGTIDPVTGEGVVTHGMMKLSDISAESWEQNSTLATGVFRGVFSGNMQVPPSDVASTAISDKLQAKAYNPISRTDYGYFAIFSAEGHTRVTVPTNGLYNTVETFLANMGGINICYPLNTPIPFTIPPQSLTPPAGDAYIWADCGSSAEVTYIGKPQ